MPAIAPFRCGATSVHPYARPPPTATPSAAARIAAASRRTPQGFPALGRFASKGSSARAATDTYRDSPAGPPRMHRVIVNRTDAPWPRVRWSERCSWTERDRRRIAAAPYECPAAVAAEVVSTASEAARYQAGLFTAKRQSGVSVRALHHRRSTDHSVTVVRWRLYLARPASCMLAPVRPAVRGQTVTPATHALWLATPVSANAWDGDFQSLPT